MDGRREEDDRAFDPVGSSESLFDRSCMFRLVTSSKIVVKSRDDYLVEVEMLCHSWSWMVCWPYVVWRLIGEEGRNAHWSDTGHGACVNHAVACERVCDRKES
jgi:hypothetical protein